MGGMLIDGQWKQQDEFAGKDGEYKRQESKCRDWITPDGSPGPDGQNAAKAEAERYLCMCHTPVLGHTGH